MSHTIKSSLSPRPSSDNVLLGIEKQQHMMNSLSTTTGGYVCSTTSPNIKLEPHHSSTQQPVQVITPSQQHRHILSRLPSTSGGGDLCIKSGTNQVTARKSSHKAIKTVDDSQTSFKTTTIQRKSAITTNDDTSNLAPSSSSISLDPSSLLVKPKYNRRNNPDLEKRRIHFCDHPGKY